MQVQGRRNGGRPGKETQMGSYEATVMKLSVSHRERCVANGDDLRRIGKAARQQVRILRSQEHLGLYTVEQPSLDEQGALGMSEAGMSRLGRTDPFGVTVDSKVVDEDMTDDEAAASGELVERLIVGGANELAVLAPHGGDIEKCTDDQAHHVGVGLEPVSPWVWMCKGWRDGGGAFDRWHITSTDISPQSFPFLGGMIRREFKHAVAFHGFDLSRFPGDDVRIGGLAHYDLKASVEAAIRDEIQRRGEPWTVSVVEPGDVFGGVEPNNIVNRLSPVSGGLQIEQSLRARRSMALQIGDAVVSAYRSLFDIASE